MPDPASRSKRIRVAWPGHDLGVGDPRGAKPPRTILLVEDDATLSSIVAHHLAAHGFPTEVVTSAEAAAQRLAKGPCVSLVLLDINLPEGTGWSLLRDPAYAACGRPPAVVVTATHVPASRLREFGVAGYLPKPFSVDTLLEIVERLAQAPADEPATEASEEGPVDADERAKPTRSTR